MYNIYIYIYHTVNTAVCPYPAANSSNRLRASDSPAYLDRATAISHAV